MIYLVKIFRKIFQIRYVLLVALPVIFYSKNVFVQNSEAELDIFIDSPSSVLDASDAIYFRLGRTSMDVADLRFKIYQLVVSPESPAHWEVLHDWVSWPIPPTYIKNSQDSAFHVDIKDINTKRIISKWLGNYYVVTSDFQDESHPYLRILNADLINRKDLKKNIDTSSARAFAFLQNQLLLQQHKSIPKAQQLHFPLWKNFGLDRESRRYFSNFFARIPSEIKEDSAIFSIGLAKLIFDSYQFGSSNSGYIKSIHQSTLNCNSFSFLLISYLQRAHIKSNFVSIATNEYGDHAFVEIEGENNFLIDLAAGLVYTKGLDALIRGESIPSFNLGSPRIFINLNTARKTITDIFVSDDIDLLRGQAFHKKSYIHIKL